MNKAIRKSVVKIMFAVLVQTMKLGLQLIRTKSKHLVGGCSTEASVSAPKRETQRFHSLFFDKDAVNMI
jgi:hypothetical protein